MFITRLVWRAYCLNEHTKRMVADEKPSPLSPPTVHHNIQYINLQTKTWHYLSIINHSFYQSSGRPEIGR